MYNIRFIEKLKTDIFMVREIGWNDYNYALFQGKTIEKVRYMVIEVVQAIKDVALVRFFGKQNKFISFFLFLAKWRSVIIDF